jgi:hypothetical protein
MFADFHMANIGLSLRWPLGHGLKRYFVVNDLRCRK